MFFSDEINLNNKNDIKEVRKFLNEFDVEFDYPDKTFVIRRNNQIIATGSAEGNILKYFFSYEEYKGQGLMGIIYNSLLNHLMEKGYDSFFVFTTPNNNIIFESLGLKEVYSTETVSLLEGGFYNYERWIANIKTYLPAKKGIRGSIIMNCNPMTLGHQYLIQKALNEVDELLIFVVEEDQSVFPFKDRFAIMENELVNEPGVILFKSGPYIISRGTFPTYFIKEKDDMLDIYTKLDGAIFGNKIAKDLDIDIRFLGTEPQDIVTSLYNETLKQLLKNSGVNVKVIPRKSIDGKIVSASHVRDLLSKGKDIEAYTLLPESTIQYLKSEIGQAIIDKLKL